MNSRSLPAQQHAAAVPCEEPRAGVKCYKPRADLPHVLQAGRRISAGWERSGKAT